MSHKEPPKPVHIPGTNRGEELKRWFGIEPGRHPDEEEYRSARDSTSINPDARDPIDPRMPKMPPP